MRLLFISAAISAAAVALVGCVRRPPPVMVWSHYDACVGSTTYVAMAECGKQKRIAYCEAPDTPKQPCGPESMAFVQYADSLALSVRNREMTDAEALRRFAEYKTSLYGNMRRDAAVVSAGEAVAASNNRTQTCTRTGNTVSCY